MKQSCIPDHFFKRKFDSQPIQIKRKRPEDFEISSSLKHIKLENPSQINPEKSFAFLSSSLPRIPELSIRTEQLINNLKLDKMVISGLFEEVMGSITAKDKYIELLDPIRKLPLPYHYRLLLEAYEKIDLALAGLSQGPEAVKFIEIKRRVKESTEAEITLKQLLQICYLSNTFELSYESSMVVVKFPNHVNSENLPQRLSEFHDILLNKVNNYHKEFLSKLPSRPQLNPIVLKTWHRSFDLHGVPDVPQLNLNTNSLISFSPKAKRINYNEDFSESSTVASEINFSGELSQNEKILRTCEMIRVIFASHRIPTMFYSQVIEKLSNGNIEKIDTVKEDFALAVKHLPRTIKIIQSGRGDIVRCSPLKNWSLHDIDWESDNNY